MALYTPTQLTSTGIAPATPIAVSASDTVDVSNGGVWIEVTNGSGSSINVTIPYPVTIDGNTVGPKVNAVPAGQTRRIFIPPIYGVNGIATVQYSATATVTVAPYQIP